MTTKRFPHLTLLSLGLCILSGCIHAQTPVVQNVTPHDAQPVQQVIASTDPTGACSNYAVLYINWTTGIQTACVNGSYLSSSLGGGGQVGPTGPQGPQGIQGPTGPTGPAGTAATVTVGGTTTGAAGTQASVTNTGTSTNAVLNFVIPQGAAGTGGSGGGGGLTPDAQGQYTIAAAGEYPLQLSSSSTLGMQFPINAAVTGGHQFNFFSSGTDHGHPGVFGVFDWTSNVTLLGFDPTTHDLGIDHNAAFEFSTTPGSDAPQAKIASPSTGVVQIQNTSGQPGTITAASLGLSVQSALPTCTAGIEGYTENLNGVLNTCHNGAWAASGSGGGGGGGTITTAATYPFGNFLWSEDSSANKWVKIGTDCVSTPCPSGVGSQTTVFNYTSEVDIASGATDDLVFMYIDPANPSSITVGSHYASVTCPNSGAGTGCIAVTGITNFPTNALPLYRWTIFNGVFTATPDLDARALFRMQVPNVSGTGIQITQASNQNTFSVDCTVVGCAGNAATFTQVNLSTPTLPTCGSATAPYGTMIYYSATFQACKSDNAWHTLSFTN